MKYFIKSRKFETILVISNLSVRIILYKSEKVFLFRKIVVKFDEILKNLIKNLKILRQFGKF